jgi:hypothetical protein
MAHEFRVTFCNRPIQRGTRDALWSETFRGAGAGRGDAKLARDHATTLRCVTISCVAGEVNGDDSHRPRRNGPPRVLAWCVLASSAACSGVARAMYICISRLWRMVVGPARSSAAFFQRFGSSLSFGLGTLGAGGFLRVMAMR